MGERTYEFFHFVNLLILKVMKTINTWIFFCERIVNVDS